MEWVSIKPSYKDGTMQATTEQAIFSLLTRAGFQLEQMRRGISGTTLEYFYFHPGLHIQVHAIQAPELHPLQFFIFYPGGGTAYATSEQQLQQCIAAIIR